MKRLAWIIALTLTPALQAQQSGVQTAVISGFVVKLGTADPIPNAGVELSRASGGPAKSYVVRASSEGQFTFKDIPAGQYRLAAAQSGFIRFEYGQRGPNGRGLTITLAGGQDLKDVRIGLPQTAAISGHIYDRKGAPMANVQVLALKYGYRGANPALLAVKAANTNDLGEYRLFGLPPARYAISALPLVGPVRDTITEIMSDGYQITRTVAPPAGAPIAGPTDDAPMRFYYPGTPDPQSAVAVTVRAADNVAAINITMNTPATRRVRGIVRNLPTAAEIAAVSNGPRIVPSAVSVTIAPRTPGSTAMYIDGAPQPPRSSVDVSTGLFELRGVLPGSYYVYAEFAGRERGMFGMTPIEVSGEDLDNISIAMAPGFDVYFRIALDGQAADPQGRRIDVSLTSNVVTRNLLAQPAAQPTGGLVVRGVAPGEYRVAVSWYGIADMGIKSIRMAGEDVSGQFRLDGPPQNPIEVVLESNKGGVVTGTAVNNKLEPTPNVTVVLVPNRGGAGKDALTDTSGRFRMTDVPPGDYTLYAWEDVERLAWQNAEFMLSFAGRGKAIHVDEGSSVSAQVSVIPYFPAN